MSLASISDAHRPSMARVGLQLSPANLADLANLRPSQDVLRASTLEGMPAWTPALQPSPLRRWLQDAAFFGTLALVALGVLMWTQSDTRIERPLGSLAAPSVSVLTEAEKAKANTRIGAPAAEAAEALPKQLVHADSQASDPTQWVEISKPFHMYDLPSPLLAKLPSLYSARRHTSVASRIDTLSFGQFASAQPWLQVSVARLAPLDRPEAGKSGQSPFFLATTRTAARAGLAVSHLAQPTSITTRFGLMEVADLQLSQAGGPPQSCTAFRVFGEAVPFQLSGLGCGAAATALASGQIVCVLDRLNLTSAGDDRELAAFFAQSEMRRGTGCTPSKPVKAEPAPTTVAPHKPHLPSKALRVVRPAPRP